MVLLHGGDDVLAQQVRMFATQHQRGHAGAADGHLPGRGVERLEKQLPSKAEMAALLSDINQAGVGRGLAFELFRPNQTVVRDYYGYGARGLVDVAASLPELAGLLRQYQAHKPATHFQRAAYYNATLGTPNEGHSQALAARLLSEWLG